MTPRLLALLLCLFIFAFSLCPAAAQDAIYPDLSRYFLESGPAPDGIFISEVPKWECGIFCGERRILAGDTLTASQLPLLTLRTYAQNDKETALSYIPILDGEAGAVQTLHLALRGSKNRAPEAPDLNLETYKNLPLTHALPCYDPDGDTLTYSLDRAPQRGSVTLSSDGSFTYTPKKNKVGTDRFFYTAKDSLGNVSEVGCVSIEIRVPRIKGTFADMHGDAQEYEALFLRERGLLSGEEIGGNLFFFPEKAVSGEEFLMMLMTLTGIPCEESEDTAWFAPWQLGALRAGICTEVSEEAIGGYEAAALLSCALGLDEEAKVSVFTDARITSDALACAALEEAGILCCGDSMSDVLTRRDAARILCAADLYLREQRVRFPWE